MCGICGMVGPDADRATRAMMRALRHRGPDDAGLDCRNDIALGMTRLAILDVSPAGHQPMISPDGLVSLVYNGETYNFRELRARLEARGQVFRSRSDTEVLLGGYLDEGPAFLKRLRGMFALAVCDRRPGPGREIVLLARDHLGIKPVLYTLRDGGLLFASELKALLASGKVEPRFDPDSLRCLLALGSIPQPRTAVVGVRMLPPGTLLRYQAGAVRLETWWECDRDRVPGLRRAPVEEQARRLRLALEDSVRGQLVSDVPVGAFLSGGVDSAVLVALMRRVLGQRVKTFSVGFGPEGRALDETGDALRLARFIGTDHTRVVVDGAMVRDAILDIATALDQPSVDGVNTYFVSRAARREVTVAISGTGGDELFGGYPWFAAMALWDEDRRQGRLPFPARRTILQRRFDRLALTGWAWELERRREHAGFLAQFHRQYRIFATGRVARLIHPQLRRAARAGRDACLDHPLAGRLPAWSPVEKVGLLCLRGYTQNQLLRDIDATSMHHSLEVRVPYLDHVLVDYAFSLPDTAKLAPNALLRDPSAMTYRQRGIKRLLLAACRDILPPGMDEQPKRGFGMPFGSWLKGPLAEVADDALSVRSLRDRGLFAPGATAGLLEDFRRDRLGWFAPWLPMMVELWCRQVLDPVGGTA